MKSFKEVARLLAQRAEDVARHLLPNGKKCGAEWKAGDISNRPGTSLGVHLIGEKAGVWKDFASGEGGDLINLWAAVRNLKLTDALNEALKYLGEQPITFISSNSVSFIRPIKKLFPVLAEGSAVFDYLTKERKITLETLAAFKISEQGEKIIFPYWRDNYLIFIKYLSVLRPEGKKEISVEKNCEPCLFGWQLIPDNARSITICEGEIDAMTLHQYGFPSLSVPFGGGGGNKQKWIEHEYDRLSVFDEIYLCFDNDPEGSTAITEISQRLGCYRCRVVKLPFKDANACLQSNITTEEIQKCFADAKTLDPEELKRAALYVEQVISEFYPSGEQQIGYAPPWAKANEKILFRPEELSVWTGINGHGKSQFLGQIILASLTQGARVCIASLELKPRRLLMRLTRQAAGLAQPAEGYIRAIHEWYGNNLWVFDLVGTAKAKRLLEVFLYARQRYGIDVFVIDSFMKIDIAEDDYNAQKSFMEQLCDFKNQYQCHIHIIVHPRKSADESVAPGKLDNKGTGAISDLADNCFTVWRNKKKENILRRQLQNTILDAKELEALNQADCVWICDKQRNGDWEGRIGLWFDPKSYQYLNHQDQRPVQYVKYSILENCEVKNEN